MCAVMPTIDFDSPLTPIKLALELPFWVLTDDASYTITVDELPITLRTISNGVDVQRGSFLSRDMHNSIYFGEFPKESKQGGFSLKNLLEGANVRLTRTQCWLDTFAVSDVWNALDEQGARGNFAMEYLSALALAHLPFVNQFINAYRRASQDPNAHEITEYDVPVWLAVRNGRMLPIELVPYLLHEAYPTIMRYNSSDPPKPFRATRPDDILERLSASVVPGEHELRDAWSLYYQGRFADAIRSAVTAIEVVLEAQLTAVLKANGLSLNDISSRIDETKNRFTLRLDDYCRASHRCIPGPTLHVFPWLNGLRLRTEFELTRKLRHDIVHCGKRLDPALQGPMRRALETTTWLFNWLSDDDSYDSEKLATYTFCESQRGLTRFQWKITKSGIRVIPLSKGLMSNQDSNDELELELSEENVIKSADVRDLPVSRFHAAIEGRPDTELFVLMAMAKLGFSNFQDIFQDPNNPTLIPRWKASIDHYSVGVFLFESCDLFTTTQLQAYAQAAAHLDTGVQPLLVVHDCKDKQWTLRSKKEIDPQLDSLAGQFGLAIAFAYDLAVFAPAARSCRWSTKLIAKALLGPGCRHLSPIDSLPIGTVRKVYAQRGVLSVQLYGSTKVSVGDWLWVRMCTSWHRCQARSIEQNKAQLDSVEHGCIGIAVSLGAQKVVIDSDVFLDLQSEGVFEDTQPQSRLRELLGRFRGGY